MARRFAVDFDTQLIAGMIEEFPDQVREAQQRHQMQHPAEIEQRSGLYGADIP
jgi:hypothetical protein